MGWGVCEVLTRLGVRRFPAERAGGKKKGPSEVVDDGPRGICVTPLYWHDQDGASLLRSVPARGRKSEARRMWSTTGLEFRCLDFWTPLLEGDEGRRAGNALGLGVFLDASRRRAMRLGTVAPFNVCGWAGGGPQ